MELLCVIGIMGIIVVAAIPALNPMMKASQLTQSGQLMGDQLKLASQTALARNCNVEVRFYQYADADRPGSTGGTDHFQAMQLFVLQDSGAAVPLGKLQRLPASVLIDSGAKLSSLLDASGSPDLEKTWTPTDPKLDLPRIGSSYRCLAFRFLPSGATSLKATGSAPWFLTLHGLNEGDALSEPPANFYTIQIDATNGHLKTFRP